MATKHDSSAPSVPDLTRLSGEQAEERTAREGRERIGEALIWLLDEKYHDDAANELAPDFAKYAAFYAESECSRLASRVEELEAAIRDAMSAAGGRWEEWGERAMTVREILERALAGKKEE